MKRTIALVLLAFTAATAHAGSFGGPTSLNTSNDTTAQGLYQSSIRGRNLSGIVRFAYDASGNPSAIASNNTYIFFVDGMLVTGAVDSAIMSAKIAGVLETGTVALTILGAIPNPSYVEYDVTGGSFNATINTSSANYFFKGNGNLQIFSQEVIGGPYSSDVRKFKISGQRTSTTE